MEALAEPVISMLLGSVTNLLKEKVFFIFHAKNDLKELRTKLEQFQKALKDVDRKPFFSNQRDRDREGELKDVLYDAQDIIEEYRTKVEVNERGKHSILQNKVQKLSSYFKEHVSFAYWLGKKIKKVNKRLDKINIDWLKTTPKEGGEGPISGEHDNPRETTQHIGAQAPIGREEDKEKVKNLLLHGSIESGVQEEHGVSIISIVGQGGIGKTTLAKMEFCEVEEQFGERRWWVCVSEKPNRKGLLLKILKEVCRASKKEPEGITSLSLSDLCTQLHDNLSKERFLLVLDDVWELDWWHGDIEGTLMKGARGSKILITTRNENVSKGMKASYMHKLPELTFHESWDLFLKMASKEESELVSHNLKDIATNIVRKCGGLPLVVQTVGSLMMEKDDWETVEKSEIWEWKMAASSSCEYGGILPGLILSYDDLPLSLKTCFVYCSIFPKDYVINREKLIRQWVAHELIEENKGIDEEVTANQYINDLIRRCLIEETEKGDLKLHDILHDLASYIGGKDYSHDFDIEHTRHLSLLSGVDVEAKPSASRGKNKLRTLLSTHESFFWSPIVAHLTNFKWLRVLSLEYCSMDELPQSIGNLSLLKYLDFSHSCVRKLPTSIGGLCNLQTMNLDHSGIEELPKEMGELCNLRHLGLKDTLHLEFIAEGLGKLSNLQTLNKFIICDDRENIRGCNMRELEGLNRLKGELSIEGLGRSRKAIHHAPQLLKEKSGLISLKLDFEMQEDEKVVNSASEQSGVLEALEPPHGLKELNISHYKGQMPAWFLQPNYAMLRTLELYDCPLWGKVDTINSLERLNVRRCPTLCEIASMPLLKFLDVWSCDGLNTIGHMPALESLEVFHCPLWVQKVIRINSLIRLCVEGCPTLCEIASMPLLKFLVVRSCDGLNTIGDMPKLESLEVRGCKSVEQVADLSALNSLVVKECYGLKTLANMPALESLTVRGCRSARLGWRLLKQLPNLIELTLDKAAWDSALPSPLPSKVSTFLPSLKSLSLNSHYFFRWGRVPECVWGLSQLEDLHLSDFTEEISLGGHWQCLQKLRRLRIDWFLSLKSLVDINIISQQNNAVATPATDVNEQIACLSRLEQLEIYNCPSLDLPQELRNCLKGRLRIIG